MDPAVLQGYSNLTREDEVVLLPSNPGRSALKGLALLVGFQGNTSQVGQLDRAAPALRLGKDDPFSPSVPL